MITKTLLFTHNQDKLLSTFICDNRMEELFLTSPDEPVCVGDIYIGKVLSVSENLNAAFLEIQPHINCFLPLEKAEISLLGHPIKQGMEIPIQIAKAAVRTKECVATMKLSLSGEYVVLTAANKKIGYSDKLSRNEKEVLRKKLVEKIPSLFYLNQNGTFSMAEDMGVIFRTSCQTLLKSDCDSMNTFLDLCNECTSLVEEFKYLLNHIHNRTCYSRLYKSRRPHELLLDQYIGQVDQVVTDSDSIYAEISDYISQRHPLSFSKLRLYQDDKISLTHLYSIESKLDEVHSRYVWLKSGANLVIDHVESMTVIDVNSGKNIKKTDKETNILAINREACEESIRQIRLRNITGMILIDFINMKEEKNEELFLNELKKLVAKEKVKTQFVDITGLGIVELIRNK